MKKNFLLEIYRTCEKIESVLQRKKSLSSNLCVRLKDFDTKNCGLISDTKFFNVIYTQLGETFGLCEAESKELTKYFTKHDGRVDYMEFLEKVDIPDYSDKQFVSGLEWEDSHHDNVISPMETRTLNLILTKIAYMSKFCLANMWLEPLFQDYRVRAQNNGSMTISLFRKILYFAGITLGDKEFEILVKRFSRFAFTINYFGFLEEVKKYEKWLEEHEDYVKQHNDDLMPGKILTVEINKLPRPEIGSFDVAEKFDITKCGHPCLTKKKQSDLELCQIMSKIKKYVKDKRIAMSQFFRDFDTFNVGLISKFQFHRGLESIGLTHGLSQKDLDVLFKSYTDNWIEDYIERIKWRKFCQDVENAENVPENYELVEIFRQSEKLPENWDDDNFDRNSMTEIAQQAMMRIRKVVKSYKIPIESYFKGFDKLNRNHVSNVQMRRVLASHSILLTEQEYRALLERYEDEIGFNYWKFLQEINETSSCDDQKNVRRIKTCPKKMEHVSVVDVLAKVRNEITIKRIKIDQFMVRGHLNKGKITRDQFRSSFASAGIDLDRDEQIALCRA